VRSSILLAQVVVFVLLPLSTLPGIVHAPFQTDFGSSVASVNSSSVGVYPAMNSTFINGYVMPTPDNLCGGAEWSPFLNSRQVSFCQSLNFQFSYGTSAFFRYAFVKQKRALSLVLFVHLSLSI
jgi:hypothetical protein